MNQKPASVLVIAIIGIVTSGLSLLFTPCGLVILFHPIAPNPVLDSLTKDPVYIGITVTSCLITLALNIALLSLSIGSLKLKPWARIGMMIYACVAMSYTLVYTAISFLYLLPKMDAVATGMPAGGGHLAMIGGIIGGVVGLLYAMALPIAILICFRRTNVVNAFKGIFPASPADFPVDYPGRPMV